MAQRQILSKKYGIDGMTAQVRVLTLAAIDAAYSAQVGKLFGVLCSADEGDLDSGRAAERFAAGLQRALTAKEMALDASIDIDEGAAA